MAWIKTEDRRRRLAITEIRSEHSTAHAFELSGPIRNTLFSPWRATTCSGYIHRRPAHRALTSGAPGDVLILFITGQGAVSPAVSTGNGPPTSATVDQLPKPVQPVTMTIGGVATQVLFAAVPPGLVGVTR